MASPVLQFKRGLLTNLPGLRAGEPGFTTDSYDLYVGLTSETSTNKFFGSHRYWTKETSSTASGVNLVEGTANGSHYITLKAPDSVSGIGTYTLPDTNTIVDGYFLKVGSGGTLSWDSVSANSSFSNVTLGGTTTVSGNFNSSANSDFSGISTFSNTTDNTLGDENTGSVQLDGGMGIAKNLTVKQNFYVGGYSEFVGVATFKGGIINLGDENTDSVIIGGRIKSNLVPEQDNSYDVGISTLNWRNAHFSGIGTFETGAVIDAVQIGISAAGKIDTSSGDLQLGSATGNTIINDRVAIGTDSVASGVLLAVGSGVTISDTSVTATTFYGSLAGSVDQVKVVTASNTDANYYFTFVDSHNVSATGETVYTDSSISYNPGTNVLSVSTATFSGNVTIDGTLTGTASTATRAIGVDVTAFSTNADYYVTIVDTSGGQQAETLGVSTALSLNPSTGDVKSARDFISGSGYLASSDGTRSLYMYNTSGDVSFQGKVIADNFRSSSNGNNTLTFSNLDATFARNLNIVGVTTSAELTIGTGVAVTQFSSSVSTGTSESSVPTSSAVINYVRSNIANVDLTLGINADSGGPSTVNTSQTLTIAGTANEVETSVSGQTITVGLPNNVIVGTSLSASTIKVATVQHSSGTQAATIDGSGNIVASQNLTVSGNLFVNGSTTQVNTSELTINDRTITLGIQTGATPDTTTWDLGILMNYGDAGVAKTAGVIWEYGNERFVFSSNSDNPSGNSSSTPNITVSTYAPIEIGALWVNDCAGQSQVISCTGTTRNLENITIDAGEF